MTVETWRDQPKPTPTPAEPRKQRELTPAQYVDAFQQHQAYTTQVLAEGGQLYTLDEWLAAGRPAPG